MLAVEDPPAPLEAVDLLVAEELTGMGSEALAMAYLSRASRAGHLCVRLLEDGILPLPSSLGEEGGLDLNELRASFLALRSSQSLTEGWVMEVNGCFYLRRNWDYEVFFKEHLVRLLTDRPSIEVDAGFLDRETRSMQEAGSLLPEQAEAIQLACRGALTLITGGPGTGKTYTAGHLLRLLCQGVGKEDRSHLEVVAAAPTGKAAAMLQASLNRALQKEALALEIPAKTLHSLLQLHRQDRARYLSADVILVDESSMMDARMIGELFASVKSGARLILLGDRDQLPPVEVGSLFSDLCSETSPLARGQLKTCLRAELKDILELAEAVNAGDESLLLRVAEPLAQDGVQFRRQLLQVVDRLFPADFSLEPQDLLEAFLGFRVLSPLRKGKFGVEGINQFLLNHFQKKYYGKGRFVAPIMVTKNDYRLGLFNGEVGILVRDYGEEVAYFPGQEGGVRAVPRLLLSAFEYAYCLSVHKSQGSEFGDVLLVIPEGAEGFGREVLYTGITRARKRIRVWGQAATLSATLKGRAERVSGISLALPDLLK